MILGDLLDRVARDARGTVVGTVIDVRLVLEPADDGGPGVARVHGVLVSGHGRTPFLGFERTGVRAPWMVAAVLRWLHRDAFLVRWTDVRAVTPDGVVLRDGFARWSPRLPEHDHLDRSSGRR